MKQTILLASVGLLLFGWATFAQSGTHAALMASAREALPAKISTSTIRSALDTALWNSNKTAVVMSITNSRVSSVFVFLKQSDKGYSPVDLSVEGVNVGFLGFAPRSAYERLETIPLRWLPRQDGVFMVLLRTRAWRDGQRYTIQTPVLIRQDGVVLRK